MTIDRDDVRLDSVENNHVHIHLAETIMKLFLQKLARHVDNCLLSDVDIFAVDSYELALDALLNSGWSFESDIEKVFTLSGHTVNHYLRLFEGEIEGFDAEPYLLPTLSLYHEWEDEWYHLTDDWKKRAESLTREERAVYMLVLIASFWDLADDPIDTLESLSFCPKEIQPKTSVLNQVKNEGLKSVVESIIDDIVRVGQITDPEFSREWFLSWKNDRIVRNIVNGIRHTHTNYDDIEYSIDVSFVDGIRPFLDKEKSNWQVIGEGLRNHTNKLIYSRVASWNEILNVVMELKAEARLKR